MQYVLALLVKVLASEPHRARLFHTASESHVGAPVEPTAVFLRLLQRSDWFTQVRTRLYDEIAATGSVGQGCAPLPYQLPNSAVARHDSSDNSTSTFIRMPSCRYMPACGITISSLILSSQLSATPLTAAVPPPFPCPAGKGVQAAGLHPGQPPGPRLWPR